MHAGSWAGRRWFLPVLWGHGKRRAGWHMPEKVSSSEPLHVSLWQCTWS